MLVGAARAKPTTKEMGKLTRCHPNRKRASKMADPVKSRAEPKEGYRYRAQCVPVVIGQGPRYRSTGCEGAGLGS